MQCQKLKTYMETGRVVFLPARSIRPNFVPADGTYPAQSHAAEKSIRGRSAG